MEIHKYNAGIIILIFGFGFFSCNVNEKEKIPTYNVLFLSVDDMNGYGFYHEYNGIKMPYLDAFKKSAITFERANCGSPVCVPSRAATYSGLYPHITGAYFNGCDPWNKSEALMKCELMPEYFGRYGYDTWGKGKIYHAKLPEGRMEKNFKNDYWGGGFSPFPDSAHQIKGNFWGFQTFDDSEFPDVKNADDAIQYLNQSHNKPFYLALGLWRPHTPFTCPQRFYDMYDLKDFDLPQGYDSNDNDDIPEIAKALLDPFGRFNAENKKEWKELIMAYAACTSFADWNIGRVIEALENSEYAKNTIVVFWSDNGYHCGEKNHWEKNTLWEQATRTPLAIRIPGLQTNGKVCKTPVNLVDLYPTLVDYCKLGKPNNALSGKSLRPLLENPDKILETPAITTFGEGFVSLRGMRYRSIQYKNGSEELYDHETDPFEIKNLANDSISEEICKSFRKFIPETFAKELPGRKS